MMLENERQPSKALSRLAMEKRSVLANLKIRNKLLIALIPLCVMALVAKIHSTYEMTTADSGYTALIDEDVKGLRSMVSARALSNRFDLLLYREISEPDASAKRAIDAELDETTIEFRSFADEAARELPARASDIRSIAAGFNQAISWSREVRTAALAGDSKTAISVMHAQVDPRLDAARQAMHDMVGSMEKTIDKQSDDLTARMQ